MENQNTHFFNSTQHLFPDLIKNICLNPEKSRGSYLYDDDSDRSILDFYCFFSTLPLGYNHPIFSTDEFKKDLLKFGGLKPSTGRILTRYIDEFVTEFHDYVNKGIFDKYFFIHGGGLAVENALKIAFDWKRYINDQSGVNVDGNELEIISFENAFHGITGYTLSVSVNPIKASHYPKFNWPKFEEPFIKFPQNDINIKDLTVREDKVLNEIKEYIERKGSKYIAGILIELIQGGGGDQHFSKNFISGLRNLADTYQILLIFDEVQTGFGVTGKLWGYEHLNVFPDLLTFGKKSQISGVCIGKKIRDIEKVINVPGRLSPTWNGDITDFIRCKYIMKAYRDNNLLENAANLGKYIISSLEEMKMFSNVRGRGFLIAFDFENAVDRNRYDELCFQEGLFLLSMREVTLRMRPNMALTKDEADHALDIINKVNRIF